MKLLPSTLWTSIYMLKDVQLYKNKKPNVMPQFFTRHGVANSLKYRKRLFDSNVAPERIHNAGDYACVDMQSTSHASQIDAEACYQTIKALDAQYKFGLTTDEEDFKDDVGRWVAISPNLRKLLIHKGFTCYVGECYDGLCVVPFSIEPILQHQTAPESIEF